MDNSLLNEKMQSKGITKHIKLESINIPKSTDNILVIPCNPSGYGFTLLDPNKELIKDILTSRVNQTIRDFNKFIDLIIIRKKVEESKNYNSTNLYVLRFLFVFALVTAFVMYELTLYDVKDFKAKYIFVPFAVLLAIVAVSLIILGKGLLTKRQFIDIDVEISKMLDKETEKENFNFYQSKGYILEKGTKFCWLAIKQVF